MSPALLQPFQPPSLGPVGPALIDSPVPSFQAVLVAAGPDIEESGEKSPFPPTSTEKEALAPVTDGETALGSFPFWYMLDQSRTERPPTPPPVGARSIVDGITSAGHLPAAATALAVQDSVIKPSQQTTAPPNTGQGTTLVPVQAHSGWESTSLPPDPIPMDCEALAACSPPHGTAGVRDASKLIALEWHKSVAKYQEAGPTAALEQLAPPAQPAETTKHKTLPLETNTSPLSDVGVHESGPPAANSHEVRTFRREVTAAGGRVNLRGPIAFHAKISVEHSARPVTLPPSLEAVPSSRDVVLSKLAAVPPRDLPQTGVALQARTIQHSEPPPQPASGEPATELSPDGWTNPTRKPGSREGQAAAFEQLTARDGPAAGERPAEDPAADAIQDPGEPVSNGRAAPEVIVPGESATPRPESPIRELREPHAEPRTALLEASSGSERASTSNQPKLFATQAREVRLTLKAEDARCEVRVLARGRALEVSVRSPDEPLNNALREQLGELARSLNEQGYQIETWTPSDTLPAMEVRASEQLPSDTPADQHQHPGRHGEWQDPRQGRRRDLWGEAFEHFLRRNL